MFKFLFQGLQIRKQGNTLLGEDVTLWFMNAEIQKFL